MSSSRVPQGDWEGEYLNADTALEMAVLAVLREFSEYANDVSDSGIRDECRPTGVASSYIGIYVPTESNEYQSQVKINYTLKVGISIRKEAVPGDRWGRTVKRAFSKRAEVIKNLISGGANQNAVDTINIANQLIDPGEADFCSPLIYKGKSTPRPKSGDWWDCEPSEHEGSFQELTFETWTFGGYQPCPS